MRLNALLATPFAIAAFVALSNGSVSAQAQSGDTQTPDKVIVAPGDNLSKIAAEHQTTYVRLYDANLDITHPDVIHPGDDIRIPGPNEQLESRPMPVEPVAAAPAKPAPAKPAPAVSRQSRPAQTTPKAVSTPANAGVWDRLAMCESGGNWSINTGNGYYGGLQFSLSSWRAVGGSGLPSDASKAEQIARAEKLQAIQGWGAWPACTKKLGIR